MTSDENRRRGCKEKDDWQNATEVDFWCNSSVAAVTTNDGKDWEGVGYVKSIVDGEVKIEMKKGGDAPVQCVMSCSF